MSCAHCDTFGGQKTYANQACLPIGGRIVCVDWCIHHIVAALNAAGIATVASCCGHQKMDGRIDLADGRVLVVKQAGAHGLDDRAAAEQLPGLPFRHWSHDPLVPHYGCDCISCAAARLPLVVSTTDNSQ